MNRYMEKAINWCYNRNDLLYRIMQHEQGSNNILVLLVGMMHVLAEYDDWYYVVVPQETIQARMDIYGTYGYIAKDQVESSTIFDLE